MYVDQLKVTVQVLPIQFQTITSRPSTIIIPLCFLCCLGYHLTFFDCYNLHMLLCDVCVRTVGVYLYTGAEDKGSIIYFSRKRYRNIQETVLNYIMSAREVIYNLKHFYF